MNNRKRIMDCVQKAHNAVTDASLESDSFSYADQIAVMTDSLISSGVIIPVRCRDCKHYYPFIEHYNKAGMCNRKMSGLIAENGFCAHGERKDNEN